LIQKVIFVFKTHFDFGFTNTAAETIESYKGKILDDVYATCNATKDMGNKKYVWTMPAFPMTLFLDNPPERKRMAEELIETGQLCWHALPLTSHFDFCGFEDYIRGFDYAKRLADMFGTDIPVSAKLTDVPGHGGMLPSFLNAWGVKFLHIGTNEFAAPVDVPLLFYWEGQDGGRVLTMYSKASYGTSLQAPRDWEYPVWMALFNSNENSGPQGRSKIQRLFKKAEEMYPGAEIIVGTMDDFYHELSRYELNVPTVRADFNDTWIHGVGTYPMAVSSVRRIRGQLTALEKAASVLNLNGVRNMDVQTMEGDISEAYRNLLFFGEHTWGIDIKTYMGDCRPYEKEEMAKYKEEDPGCRLLEFSWEEQRNRAILAAQHTQNAEQILMQSIAHEGREQLIVFNPSGRWENRYINLQHLQEQLAGAQLLRGDEIFTPEWINNVLYVYITQLPPLTFSSFTVKYPTAGCEGSDILSAKEAAYGNSLSIENKFYRISVSASGQITELFDKRTCKNMIDTNSEEGFAAYRYDRYGIDDMNNYLRNYGYYLSGWGIEDNGKRDYPKCPHVIYRPETKSVQIDNENRSITIWGQMSESFHLYGDAENIITKITLPSHTDEIYIKVKLLNKQETAYAESGYITMPFNLPEGTVLLNRLGNMIDITRDIAKDANHANYCIEHFAAVDDGDRFAAVFSPDIPLVSVDEVGIYKFRSTYKPRGNALFFNCFNNMWGTNFPQWMGGDYEYDFIVSFGNHDALNEQYYKSLSYAEAFPSYLSGKDITCRFDNFLKLPLCLRPSALMPYNDGYLLRLRDTGGIHQNAAISINCATVETVRLIDLRDNVLQEFPDPQAKLNVSPYGIYNLFFIPK